MTELEIKTSKNISMSIFKEAKDYLENKPIPLKDTYDKKWVSVESLIELRKSLERKINKLNSFFAMKKYQIESKGRLLTVNQFLEDELKQLKELGE